MKDDRWSRVKELFHAALEWEPSERAAFLDSACADDAKLRAEVEGLLASDAHRDDFLRPPTADLGESEEDGSTGDHRLGQLVGAYRLDRVIGSGGMGTVFAGSRADGAYEKNVAVKLVKRGFESEDTARRFRRERQALARLDHPNIARLLDGGVSHDGQPYFVMDHIDGPPITQFADEHRLTTVARLRLFEQVCAAVQYAHQNLIIHRDLKPSNILVTSAGVPKLLDFGIAKLLDEGGTSEGTVLTQAGLQVMTPEYASPEQVRGEQMTTATDVYSLGVVLYELLTGHRPYRFETRRPQEIERVICEQEPARPSTAIRRKVSTRSPGGSDVVNLTPESVSQPREGHASRLRRRLAGDLDNVTLKALRKEPLRRYASVEQFSEDIRRHLNGLPVLARKDTLWYRGAKFARRHGAAVAAACLVSASLLVAIATTQWEVREVVQQRDVARAERANAERRELTARRHLYAAHMVLAQQAWDGAHMARVLELLNGQRPAPGQEDLRGFEWHLAWRIAHSELATFEGHCDVVRSLVVSPDGTTMYSGSDDGSVRLWDTRTGQGKTLLQSNAGEVHSLALAPDGATLAVGIEDGSVVLWDVRSGQTAVTLAAHADVVRCVAFSPDGRILATAGDDETAKLWDVHTRRERSCLTGHDGAVYSLAFSADGHTLATGSQDATIRVWSVDRGVEHLRIDEHEADVYAVAFSPDGNILASGSGDWSVKLWDPATGDLLESLEENWGEVYALTFSPDGRLLATGSDDSTVRLWDIASGEPVFVFRGHLAEVYSVAFSPDGTQLAAGSGDHTLKLWDPADFGQPFALEGHTDTIRALAFSPAGDVLCTTDDEEAVIVWDLAAGRQRTLLTGNEGVVTALAFSPDGTTLAAGGEDEVIRLWDTSAWKVRLSFECHCGETYALAFSPDGQTLAVAGEDETVELWNPATGRRRTILEGHTDIVRGLAFSPDGALLASGSVDASAILWSLPTGDRYRTLTGHQEAITSIVFSPDGATVACGSKDMTVTVWDVAAGDLRTTLRGHENEVVGVAYTPDGKTFATGSIDGVIILQDPVTGQQRVKLERVDDELTTLAFSPDGGMLATGGDMGAIELWDASPPAEDPVLSRSE